MRLSALALIFVEPIPGFFQIHFKTDSRSPWHPPTGCRSACAALPSPT